MSLTPAPPAQLRAYNPDWLSDDDLLSGFIARKPLFEFLRDELRRVPRSGTVQARLLTGVRGAGKTTLLKRLAVAIRREAELADHLIALSFPEELYQVKGLADLWWAASEALADELMAAGQNGPARALLDQIDQRPLPRAGEDPHDDRGLLLLLRTCKDLGRRPVLLLDNFDLLLDRIDKDGRKTVNPQSRAYWVLREVLSSPDAPVLIGGSARLSEPLVGYDKAFFDFFIPHRLGKLSLEEVLDVFGHLARQHGDEALRERLRQRRGRVSALYEMTGGNPRALMLIFDLLRQGPGSRAVDDFERLLDLSTPYYKARFEDLPEQAQVVMHALAMIRRESLKQARYGHTAATIARRAGLETRIVSAQLDVLIRAGVVEKNNASVGRVQYRIAEQLFRLWLQMRSSRRIRHQVVGLTEYLEALFDRSELERVLQESLATRGSELARARIAYAVGELQLAAPDRHYFQSHAAEAASDGRGVELPQLFADGDLPDDLQRLAVCRQRLKACEARLRTLRADAPELISTLLGSLKLSLADKCAAVERLLDADRAYEELARLSPLLEAERRQLLRNGLSEDDLTLLYRERAAGRLQLMELSPRSKELAASGAIRGLVWNLLAALLIPLPTEVVASAWVAWGQQHFSAAGSRPWAGIARACRRAGLWGDAFQGAMRIAFEGEVSARAWLERAEYLREHQSDSVEAEAAYRRAIEIDPADALLWNNLGMLLAESAQRSAEAEAAFCRAITLDPHDAYPQAGLGNLLAQNPERHDEAEAAYRRAIELDPAGALPWNNLGSLLAEIPQRHAEAEAAFRRAIELDPANDRPWYNLGILLSEDTERHAEAEAAYRRAIELDPANDGTWYNLGILLSQDPERLAEAEFAYRRALELDPSNAWRWNNLGALLAGNPQRQSEAEAAYRQAIDLSPADAVPWNNLGALLDEKPLRHAEAEAAYRRAIGLDPKNPIAWINLGNLLAKDPERRSEAEAAFAQCLTLVPDDLYARWRLSELRTHRALDVVRVVISRADWPATRQALQNLHASSELQPGWASERSFLSEVIAPCLRAGQGSWLLDTLRELGYESIAAPLLLAIEALLDGDAKALEGIEPELRRASQQVFAELQTALGGPVAPA
jgi:Flp pilus assembly protein TadD